MEIAHKVHSMVSGGFLCVKTVGMSHICTLLQGLLFIAGWQTYNTNTWYNSPLAGGAHIMEACLQAVEGWATTLSVDFGSDNSHGSYSAVSKLLMGVSRHDYSMSSARGGGRGGEGQKHVCSCIRIFEAQKQNAVVVREGYFNGNRKKNWQEGVRENRGMLGRRGGRQGSRELTIPSVSSRAARKS